MEERLFWVEGGLKTRERGVSAMSVSSLSMACGATWTDLHGSGVAGQAGARRARVGEKEAGSGWHQDQAREHGE